MVSTVLTVVAVVVVAAAVVAVVMRGVHERFVLFFVRHHESD